MAGIIALVPPQEGLVGLLDEEMIAQRLIVE